MTVAPRPSLLAIVQAAIDATGASSGWLLRASEEGLQVIAAIGPVGSADPTGTMRLHQGAAGYSVASGQPAALQLQPDDTANEGAGNATGVPTSLLATPCTGDEIEGVLEVADAPSGRFTFDDVEMIALLSDIAGAVLSEDDSRVAAGPSPAELAAGLGSLAERDPARYASVARVISGLL